MDQNIREWINTLASVFAAIGTVTAVILSLYYSRYEYRLRKIDKKDQDEKEKRIQANMIAAWISDIPCNQDKQDEYNFVTMQIVNNSRLPIYNIVAKRVRLYSDGSVTPLNDEDEKFIVKIDLLPPGEQKYRIRQPDGGMSMRFGLELAFQDSAGQSWIRQGDGILKEISENPILYYDISRPTLWSSLF